MTPVGRTRLAAGGRWATAMAALNARHPWNHNDYFHGWVLTNLPRPCRTALDVGCGRGTLLAALAPHVDEVTGTDADATMREAASRRCAGLPNVTVRAGTWAGDDDSLDLVTMVAVLHHLDVPAALQQVRRLLRPGGRFLAVGLAPPETVGDHLWDLASVLTNPLVGWVTHPWPVDPDRAVPEPVPVRDPTLTVPALRRLIDVAMPGAVLRQRIAFRHTVAWTKPQP